MTRHVGSTERLKPSRTPKLLPAVGSVLIMAGFISQSSPQLLEHLMSAHDAGMISDNAYLIIIAGFALTLIPIIIKIRQHQQASTVISEPISPQSSAVERKTSTHNLLEKNDLFDIDESLTPTLASDFKPETLDWTPLKRGGSNFKTHLLKVVDNNKVIVKPSVQLVLFCSLFMIFGAVFSILFIVNTGEWIPGLIGSFFFLIGAAMLYLIGNPRQFDKQLGYYWKGRIKQSSPQHIQRCKDHASLNDIVALQVIQEYVTGDKSAYHSYELNLVLSDGRRLCVMDHGNKQQLLNDAEALASFLDVPLLKA